MQIDLAERINTFKTRQSLIAGQLAYEEKNLTRLKGKIDQLEKDKIELLKVQALIDRAITTISANGIGKIESVVTAGLRQVFGNRGNLRFIIEKRQGTRGNNYRLKVQKTRKDGKVIQGDVLKSFGGGLANVISFLLRVMMIKRFKLAQIIVLDEAFNNVSRSYQPKVSQMLETLCNKHGFIILAVTHQSILTSAADAVYKVVPQDEDGELSPVLQVITDASELEEIDARFEASKPTPTEVSRGDRFEAE